MLGKTSKIELRFGPPSSAWREELTTKRAIECNISYERMLLIDFEDMFINAWMKEDRESIFELLIFIHAGVKVDCRNVSFGTYIHNGFKYPKVVMQSDTFKSKKSGKLVRLSDSVINSMGEHLDGDFDFEYVEFKRIGK